MPAQFPLIINAVEKLISKSYDVNEQTDLGTTSTMIFL